MTTRTAAAIAALLACTRAFAADPGPASELARLVVPPGLWSENLDVIGKQVQMQLTAHPGAKLEYPADFPKTVRTELDKAFPYEEMIGAHTQEIAAAFTDAEVKELLAFYRSPTGAKWHRTSGEVQAKADQVTQKRLQERMPEIMGRLAKLGKAPAGGAKSSAPAGHPATPAPAQKAPAGTPPKK